MIDVSLGHQDRLGAATRALDRDSLYKADHPRWIDRYIDFFGTGLPRRGSV